MTAEIDSLVVAPTPVQDHVWWRRIDRRTPVRPGIRMPWVDRAASSAAVPDPMVAHEFAIECVAVTPETPGITSFTFRRRDGVALGFRPGQYLNVAFPVDPDGGLRERNYSLSSSPFDPSAFRLTIQREDTGAVSRWAHEHVRPGTALEALGPLGGFHLPDVDRRARYLLLAGGVGITPLISMARTLHALDGTADVVVLYHASTPRDFAFARELRILDETDPRFTVGFSLGDRPSPEWRGLTGRISAESLDALVPDACGRRVYACGPAGYLERTAAAVEAVGVSPLAFFTECFDDTAPEPRTEQSQAAEPQTTQRPVTTGPGAVSSATAAAAPADAPTASASPAPAPSAPPRTPAPVRDVADTRHWVTFARTGTSAPVETADSLLQAGRRAGVPLRSNCSSGMCGTCKVGLLAGEVTMDHSGGIRRREIDAGTILLCCSTPEGDVVVDA